MNQQQPNALTSYSSSSPSIGTRSSNGSSSRSDSIEISAGLTFKTCSVNNTTTLTSTQHTSTTK